MSNENKNQDDIILNAERELVEQMFRTNVIDDSTFTQKEQEIRKLAGTIFLCLFDPEERDEVLFGPGRQNPIIMAEFLDKAERLYDLSGDYTAAKKIVNVLISIDQTIAKQLMEQL